MEANGKFATYTISSQIWFLLETARFQIDLLWWSSQGLIGGDREDAKGVKKEICIKGKVKTYQESLSLTTNDRSLVPRHKHISTIINI